MSVSALAHVELRCPDVAATQAFMVEAIGMQVAGEAGDRVFLRCHGDWLHHTLVLSPGDEPGIGHVGWAVATDTEAEAVAERARARGCGVESWRGAGHGPAWRIEGADGHVHELVVALHRTRPGAVGSQLANQPHALRGRGVEPRRLDHVNVLAPDVGGAVAFAEDVLGLRVRERVTAPDGTDAGAWMSVSNLVHDIAFTRDATGASGRLHHVALWLDSREQLLRAADLLVERGVELEAGPGKHAVTQGLYLYFHEPSGNRLELFAGGYQIFEPAWEPIVWTTDVKDAAELALSGSLLREVLADSARAVT